MRILFCFAAHLTLGLFLAALSQADIPDVATLDDLRKAELIELPGQWEARIGVADGGAEAGPWKLMYCLARYTGEGDAPPPKIYRGPGTVLGPVGVTASDHEPRSMAARAVAVQAFEADAREYLFCTIVLTTDAGKYPLRIYGADGQVVRERTVTVEQPAPCYWQAFAAPVADQQALADDDEDAPASYQVATQGTAGYPVLDGAVPLLGLTAKGEIVIAGQRVLSEQSRDKAAARNRLPGAIPLDMQWWDLATDPRERRMMRENETDGPLQLELENGTFVISGTPFDPHPKWHLLARWWVNDEAVIPPRQNVGVRRENGLVMHLDQYRIVLGLPASLGPLKVGDRVSVQVLYCPQEFEPLPEHISPDNRLEHLTSLDEGLAVPLLTNRLTFKVTEAMLHPRNPQ